MNGFQDRKISRHPLAQRDGRARGFLVRVGMRMATSRFLLVPLHNAISLPLCVAVCMISVLHLSRVSAYRPAHPSLVNHARQRYEYGDRL